MFRPNLSHIITLEKILLVAPPVRSVLPCQKKWLAMCSGEKTHSPRLSYTWKQPCHLVLANDMSAKSAAWVF